ncbi:MAG: cupin domain-containing protein [Candidatus Aminicenantaceae bacterium]
MTNKSTELKGKGILLNEAIEYSKGSIVSKTIIEKKTGTITLFSFDEGQNLSEHKAPFDALVFIIDGEGEIIINKRSHILKTGQMIIMPANIPHAVNAKKKFKMLLTMIKDK